MPLSIGEAGVVVVEAGGGGTELVVPLSMGEAGVVVVEAGGGGTAELDGGAAGVVLTGGRTGVEEGFSWHRVQVVIVLVIKLVFTMMEVLPLITVVDVTGQLVKVV